MFVGVQPYVPRAGAVYVENVDGTRARFEVDLESTSPYAFKLMAEDKLGVLAAAQVSDVTRTFKQQLPLTPRRPRGGAGAPPWFALWQAADGADGW